MAGQSSNLDTLKQVATTYFTSEKKRLNAEYDFLKAIASKRGGVAGLQDANASGASKIMVDSVNAYLGSPLSPDDSIG